MPHRSNKFQRLIYLIHDQLHDNARVCESKMLTDRETGRQVEVDVVIELETGEYSLTVGVECRDRSRRASIEWVNEMLQKHAPLTDRLILVSSCGFTKEACKKASLHNVETISLDDALHANWKNAAKGIGTYRIAQYSIEPLRVLGILRDKTEQVAGYYLRPDIELHSVKKYWSSVRDLVQRLCDIKDFTDILIKTGTTEDAAGAEVTVPVPPGGYFIDEDGEKQYLESIDIAFAVDQLPNALDFTLREGKLKNTRVIWGEYENHALQAFVAFTSKDGEKPKASAMIVTHDGSYKALFDDAHGVREVVNTRTIDKSTVSGNGT